MPRRQRTYRGGRGLLNRSGFQSTAAVVAEIEDTSGWKAGHDEDGNPLRAGAWVRVPHYTFQFANCDRSISFELDWGFEEGHVNNLHKLDTMIEALTKFRKAVADEQDLMEARKRLTGQWGTDE